MDLLDLIHVRRGADQDPPLLTLGQIADRATRAGWPITKARLSQITSRQRSRTGELQTSPRTIQALAAGLGLPVELVAIAAGVTAGTFGEQWGRWLEVLITPWDGRVRSTPTPPAGVWVLSAGAALNPEQVEAVTSQVQAGHGQRAAAVARQQPSTPDGPQKPSRRAITGAGS